MKSYTFKITKEIEIEAPNSWTKGEMKQLAEEICDGTPSDTDWDLKNMSYYVDYIKVDDVKK